MEPSSSDPRGEAPPKFYKYRPVVGDAAKWVEKIVLGCEAYFARPGSFNDPFDCRPTFSFEGTDEEVVADYLRISRKCRPDWTEEDLRADAEQIPNDPLRDPRLPHANSVIQTEHSRRITNDVGVFCVTPHSDNTLMWAHYADSHRGVCLEFDGGGKLMAHAQKVSYSALREPIRPYLDSQEVMMEKALLTKDVRWAYEDEWRLIDYKLGPGTRTFRPQNLTGIVVGDAAPQATLDLMRQWTRARVTPLRLYQARTSTSTYALEIAEIDV